MNENWKEENVPCNDEFVRVEGDKEIWECPYCHRIVEGPLGREHNFDLWKNSNEPVMETQRCVENFKKTDYGTYENASNGEMVTETAPCQKDNSENIEYHEYDTIENPCQHVSSDGIEYHTYTYDENESKGMRR